MKALLLTILRGLSPLFSLNHLIRLSGEKLFLPVYHLSSDHPCPHIEHIYPIRNSQTFRQDLDTLLKHYQPLSWPELKTLIEEKRAPDKPSFFLSFDDGLREIHEVVAPILAEKGVPACFFLNPAFLDNRQLFFRFKAGLLIDRMMKADISITQQKKIVALFSTHQLPFLRPASFLNITYQQQAILDQAGKILAVDFGLFLQKQQPYLSTKQVRNLLSQGFSIGAHSMDHPMYGDLPLAEQHKQTIDSIQFLQENFGMTDRIFAFPFTDDGVAEDFFTQSLHPDQGFMDASFGCAGIKHETFDRHLQRFPMERSQDSATQLLKTEYLYYLVKGLLGKNVIHRPKQSTT
ncbi:MAG: polysaccharide deacetylase family protein [Bacteroidota bacterium]